VVDSLNTSLEQTFESHLLTLASEASLSQTAILPVGGKVLTAPLF
jgi:hypothetical protein